MNKSDQVSIQKPRIRAKVYVRSHSWSAYVVSDDGIGAPITVGLNQSTMDPDIYAKGWAEYVESAKANGYQVQVYML